MRTRIITMTMPAFAAVRIIAADDGLLLLYP